MADIAEMSQTYRVRGRWPFPADMLRHDGSKAATPEDQVKIDLLSADYAADRSALRDIETINLVIPEAGRFARPNTARWESFGWSVPDDAEYAMLKSEREMQKRLEKLQATALAKLTPEERQALEWGGWQFPGATP